MIHLHKRPFPHRLQVAQLQQTLMEVRIDLVRLKCQVSTAPYNCACSKLALCALADSRVRCVRACVR